MAEIIKIDKNTDLVYSPDDRGWYFQRFVGNPVKDYVSKVFKTEVEAVRAYQKKCLEWKPL